MARTLAAATANDVNSPNARDCLRGYLPYTGETVNSVDDAIFALQGWIYNVTVVSATFGEGGTVELVGVGNVKLASFTEPGTITGIEIPFGNFRWVPTLVTDLVAQITSAAY